MTCLIIEDELAAARGLTKALERACEDLTILGVIETVKEALAWFEKNTMPDLLFLDIHLKDGDSFEILEKVTITAPIIFCTAYDQYALRAFQANSISYLLKPVSEEDLQAALDKLELLRSQGESTPDLSTLVSQLRFAHGDVRFLTKTGQRFAHIELKEIAYFFKEHTAVYAKAQDGTKHQVEQSLEQLERTVPTRDFFRINRQFLVSADSVVNFESDYGSYPIVLQPPMDKEVTISRYRIHEFKRWLSS